MALFSKISGRDESRSHVSGDTRIPTCKQAGGDTMVCIDVAIDATSSFAKARTLEQRALILASSPSPEQIRAWHRLVIGSRHRRAKALLVDYDERGLS